MPQYTVRAYAMYFIEVDADSEEEAIEKAPDLPPNNTDWDACKPDFEAEEYV